VICQRILPDSIFEIQFQKI